MKSTTFVGVKARLGKPTQAHEPAMWGGILGTVYARNAAGVTEYFDYNYDAAREFIGMDQDSDPRVARNKTRFYVDIGTVSNPFVGQWTLYVNRNPATKRFADALKTPPEKRSKGQRAAITLGRAAIRKLYTPEEVSELLSSGVTHAAIGVAALRGKRLS